MVSMPETHKMYTHTRARARTIPPKAESRAGMKGKERRKQYKRAKREKWHWINEHKVI